RRVSTSLSLSSSFFTVPPPTDTYTLSLHDALPIFDSLLASNATTASSFEPLTNKLVSVAVKASLLFVPALNWEATAAASKLPLRSEEHTSELQSRENLVCRLLLEKKKKKREATQSE